MSSEMDKLELYLKENGFDYERITEEKPDFGMFDQIRCGEWDAVCHNGSYGHEVGLLETYGMPEDHGDVTGWLTADDVIKRIAPTSRKRKENGMNAKVLKENYLEVRENSNNPQRSDDEKQFSFRQLQALRDMAKADVYPDGRFGDDECNVWSMFHMLCN